MVELVCFNWHALIQITPYVYNIMGIVEQIEAIKFEYARTQKNKATEYHTGRLKARLAQLEAQLLAES